MRVKRKDISAVGSIIVTTSERQALAQGRAQFWRQTNKFKSDVIIYSKGHYQYVLYSTT
jgi:transketolase N-terminal domain/subunit